MKIDYEELILRIVKNLIIVIIITLVVYLVPDDIEKIKKEYPKMYSKDLVENLFKHPYTKIDFVMGDLQVSKPTAIQYLNKLIKLGLLKKERRWKTNYYINERLYKLFT